MVLTILKNISQWDRLSHIYYGNIKFMIETTNQISISRGWTTLYHQRYPCPTGKFHQLSLGNLSSLDQWQIPWKPHGQWLKNVRFPENWPDLVDKEKAIENGHGDSELSHYTWWFSIVFCMFTRGYLKKTRSPNLEKCKKHLKKKPMMMGFSLQSQSVPMSSMHRSSVTKELQYSVAPRDMDKVWRGAETSK